jgi:hypothetical protein
MSLTRMRVLACIALLILIPGLAWAEASIQLRVGRGPHYAGVPIDVHVIGQGFAQEPEPTCSHSNPSRGKLQLTGIVPKLSSSVQIVNGKVFQSRTAEFTCQYRLTTDQVGSVVLGSFQMEQAGVSRSTQAQRIVISKVDTNTRVRIRIRLPKTPVYVGQQVPVRVEWWLDANLADSIRQYTIRSELFDRDDVFDFIGDSLLPNGSRDQGLQIQTSEGELRLSAEVEKRREGSTQYLVIVAERTLVPLRPGHYDLAPATVLVEEVTRWQRDLFGGRRAAGTRRAIGRDEAHRLIVERPPTQGRPDSFAGAVGRGFSFEVSADRSVVQLGDPITLTLEVKGGGNLAYVGLPDLGVAGALAPNAFRLPEDDVTGELDGDTKRFRIPVRVIDDAVREIPALTYSWFDPELGRYERTESRPIALSVRAAEVITADDVQSASPRPSSEAEPGSAEPAPTSVRGSLSLTGADLSIVEDPAALRSSRATTAVLEIGSYALSLLILIGAFILRTRNAVPTEVRQRRALLRTGRERIEAAASRPRDEAVLEMATVLRELAAATGRAPSTELDGFLQDCDAVLYAPTGSADTPLEAEWKSRALQQLEALGEDFE